MGVTLMKNKLLALTVFLVVLGLSMQVVAADGDGGCQARASTYVCNSYDDCLVSDEDSGWHAHASGEICDMTAGTCGCKRAGNECQIGKEQGYRKDFADDECKDSSKYYDGVCVSSSNPGYDQAKDAISYCEKCDTTKGTIASEWIVSDQKYIDESGGKCYAACGADSGCDLNYPGTVCRTAKVYAQGLHQSPTLITSNAVGRCKASNSHNSANGCLYCVQQCENADSSCAYPGTDGYKNGYCAQISTGTGYKFFDCRQCDALGTPYAYCNRYCDNIDLACHEITSGYEVMDPTTYDSKHFSCTNQCKAECSSGFGNCDGDWSDGCEVDLNSDYTCGKTCEDKVKCKSGEICKGGECIPTTCNLDLYKENGEKIDKGEKIKVGEKISAKLTWSKQGMIPDFSINEFKCTYPNPTPISFIGRTYKTIVNVSTIDDPTDGTLLSYDVGVQESPYHADARNVCLSCGEKGKDVSPEDSLQVAVEDYERPLTQLQLWVALDYVSGSTRTLGVKVYLKTEGENDVGFLYCPRLVTGAIAQGCKESADKKSLTYGRMKFKIVKAEPAEFVQTVDFWPPFSDSTKFSELPPVSQSSSSTIFDIDKNCDYNNKAAADGTYSGSCESARICQPKWAGGLAMAFSFSGGQQFEATHKLRDCVLPDAVTVEWDRCGGETCGGEKSVMNVLDATYINSDGKDYLFDGVNSPRTCNSTFSGCCLGGNYRGMCNATGQCDSSMPYYYCGDNVACGGPGVCGWVEGAENQCGKEGKSCCGAEDASKVYGVSAKDYCDKTSGGKPLACCVDGTCRQTCKPCAVYAEPVEVPAGVDKSNAFTKVTIKYKNVTLPIGVTDIGQFNVYCEGSTVTNNVAKTDVGGCKGTLMSDGKSMTNENNYAGCKATCNYNQKDIKGVVPVTIDASALDNPTTYGCYPAKVYLQGSPYCTVGTSKFNIKQGDSVTVNVTYGNLVAAPGTVTFDCGNGTNGVPSSKVDATGCWKNPSTDGSCKLTNGCTFNNVSLGGSDQQIRTITASIGDVVCRSATVNVTRSGSCGQGDCAGVWTDDAHTICSTNVTRTQCCATSKNAGYCNKQGACFAAEDCKAGATCSERQCGGKTPCGDSGEFCWGAREPLSLSDSSITPGLPNPPRPPPTGQGTPTIYRPYLNDYIEAYCKESSEHSVDSCNDVKLECCDIDSKCYSLGKCPKCAVTANATSVYSGESVKVTVKIKGMKTPTPLAALLVLCGNGDSISAKCIAAKVGGSSVVWDVECKGSCSYDKGSPSYSITTSSITDNGGSFTCGSTSVQVIDSAECKISLDRQTVTRGDDSTVTVSYGGLGGAPGSIQVSCSDGWNVYAMGCNKHPGSCSVTCNNTRSGKGRTITAKIGSVNCSTTIDVIQPACGVKDCAGLWADDSSSQCSSSGKACCSSNQKGTCDKMGNCTAGITACTGANEKCVLGNCQGPDKCGKDGLLCCSATYSPTKLGRYCDEGLGCCGSLDYAEGICRNECQLCDGVFFGKNAECDAMTGKPRCLAGYSDCNGKGDGSDADGCEVDVATNPLHCGACGNRCGKASDSCGPVETWNDFNGNGKWDTADQTCQSGVCVDPSSVVQQSTCSKTDEWCAHSCFGSDGDSGSCACGCSGGGWGKMATGTYACCGDDFSGGIGGGFRIPESWLGACGGNCDKGAWSGSEGDQLQTACECLGGIWVSELSNNHKCCGDDPSEDWIDGQYFCSSMSEENGTVNVESYKCAPTGECPKAKATTQCGYQTEKIAGGKSYFCDGTKWRPRPDVFLFPYAGSSAPVGQCLATSQDGWSSIQLGLQACTKYLVGIHSTTPLGCTSSSTTECNVWVCDAQLNSCSLAAKAKTLKGDSNLEAICTDSSSSAITKIYGRTGEGGLKDVFGVKVEDPTSGLNHTTVLAYSISPEGKTTYDRGTYMCGINTHCLSDSDCYGSDMFCDEQTSLCTEKCSDFIGSPGTPNEGLCMAQCGAAVQCAGHAPGTAFSYQIPQGVNVNLTCDSECQIQQPVELTSVKVSTLDGDSELNNCGTSDKPCFLTVESSAVSYMTFATELGAGTNLPAKFKLYIWGEGKMELFREWDAQSPSWSEQVVLNENIAGLRDAVLVVDAIGSSSAYKVMRVSFSRKAKASIEMPKSDYMCVYRTASSSTSCEQQEMTVRISLNDLRSGAALDGQVSCEVSVSGKNIGSLQGATNSELKLNYAFTSASPNGEGKISCRVTSGKSGSYYQYDQQIEKGFNVYGTVSTVSMDLPGTITPGSSISLNVLKIQDDRGDTVATPSVCWQLSCSSNQPRLLGCDKSKYSVPSDLGVCNGILTAIVSAPGYEFYTRDFLVNLNSVSPFTYSLFPSRLTVPLAGGTPEFSLSVLDTGIAALNLTVQAGSGVKVGSGGEWASGNTSFFIAGGSSWDIPIQVVVAPGAARTEPFSVSLYDNQGNFKKVEGEVIVSATETAMVSIEPKQIQFLETELNKQATAKFKIKNTGNVPDEYRLLVKGDAGEFVKLSAASLLVAPNEEKEITLTLSPPEVGMYSFDVCAISDITAVQYCVTGIASIAAKPIEVTATPTEVETERGKSVPVAFKIVPGSLTTAVELSLDKGTCEGWIAGDDWAGKVKTLEEQLTATVQITPTEVGECTIKLTVVDPQSKTVVSSVRIKSVHSAEEFRALEELSSQVGVDISYLDKSMEELKLGGEQKGTLGALKNRALDALQKCNDALANRDYDTAKLYCENARTSAVSSSNLVLYVRQVETAQVPTSGMNPMVIIGLILILVAGLYLVLYRK